MVFRRLLGNTSDPTIRTERLKLFAGGCQLIAVGIFVSSLVAPIFNPTLTISLTRQLEGGIGFAVFELLAMHILGYIPPTKED